MSLTSLLYITVAVILPIVPAYLLYRLLPSESQVEGPWQGLRIKLGGAFGGYFLLVITIFFFARSLPTYEVWNVRGQVLLDEGDERIAQDLVEFKLIPSGVAISPDGRFDLDVFAHPGRSSGLLELPVLVVGYAGYRPEPVHLDDESQVEKHGLEKRVVLKETVVLRPDPDEPDVHQ